jgi:hypothetical protein
VSDVTHNPACVLVLTKGREPCNCIRPEPSVTEIKAEARRIHRCPTGYNGPCRGPTAKDRRQAYENLSAAAPEKDRT